MAWMFFGCGYFNQPLDKWNTSNVTDMEGMFSSCVDFNQDLNSWNISKNCTTYNRFYDCFKMKFKQIKKLKLNKEKILYLDQINQKRFFKSNP